MLPYLDNLVIDSEKWNSNHNYSIYYIKYEISGNITNSPYPGNFGFNGFNGNNNVSILSPKFYTNNFILNKNYNFEELELKFVEIAIKKEKHIFSIINGNDSGESFFDIEKNDYIGLNDNQLDVNDPIVGSNQYMLKFRKFLTRIYAWKNYLSTINMCRFEHLVVHDSLFKILTDNGLNENIFSNKYLPKNKIVFLTDSSCNGNFKYVEDDIFNDIILSDNDMLATVDLLSLSDIRDQKINTILE